MPRGRVVPPSEQGRPPELEPTQASWVDRALNREQRPNFDGIYPPSRQTAVPADFTAFLPLPGGDLPQGPKLAHLARVLKVRARARREIQRGASPGVIETDAAAAAEPVRVSGPIQVTQRRTQSNYRATFTGETVLLPSSRQRSYLLVINIGANDVWLAFDKIADSADGIPLRTPDGFLELEQGTASEVRAFVAGAGTGALIVVEGLYYPALERAG